MRALFVMLLVIGVSIPAEARKKTDEIPLMDSGISREVRKISYMRRTQKRYTLAEPQMNYRSEPIAVEKPTWGFGIEMGAVGRPNNSDSDLFGLHYVFGGRIAAYGPIARSWAVKPSVGYFYRGDGLSGVSVAEHQVQAEFDFFFAPGQEKRIWWMGGLAQRVDMILTRLQALRSTVTSDPQFRYSFGPTMALGFRLGSAVLHTQFTATFQPVKGGAEPYFGFTLGLLFGSSNKTFVTRRRPRSPEYPEISGDEISRR